MRKRLRAAVRTWQYRREFKRVLRSWGVQYPTRQQIDMGLDFELDRGWLR